METTQPSEPLELHDDEILRPDHNRKRKKKISNLLVHPNSLKAASIVSQVKKSGKRAAKELLIDGLIVQLYYVLYDVRHGYGLSRGPKHTRARENIGLLLLHNLPKYLVVVGLVGWVPIPGTAEAVWAVLYNKPKLWKYRNMKFQKREDIPADVAVGKLKRYGHQIIIILNTMA